MDQDLLVYCSVLAHREQIQTVGTISEDLMKNIS